MRLNKKVIIEFGLFAVVFVVVTFFVARQGQTPETTVSPTPYPVETPIFPTSFPSPQPAYQVNTPLPTFPATVEVYAYAPIDLKGFASDLAARLGFAGSPTELSGSRGAFFTWTRGPEILSVGADPVEISYMTGASPTSLISESAQSLRPVIDDFLTKVVLISPVFTRRPLPSLYFAPQGNTPNQLPNQNGATVVQLNFRYAIGDLPLFTRLPDVPSVSAKVVAPRSLSTLTLYWFPSLSKQPGSVQIIPVQTAIARLQNKEGILAALASNEDRNSEDLPNHQVTTSIISDIKLGYYYSPGNKLLAPVYVFHGQGTDAASAATVFTTTIVSALP